MANQYAPRADDNPWRLDTFMNVDEWKVVSGWYPFSLRSLLPDGRWYEIGRFGIRDKAYDVMKLSAAAQPGNYYALVQCTLVGNDGREKAVVFAGGSEQTILNERARRLAKALF